VYSFGSSTNLTKFRPFSLQKLEQNALAIIRQKRMAMLKDEKNAT